LKAQIFGCGSIGAHLSNACVACGIDVLICDISEAAINRFKKDLYPSRYGEMPANIKIVTTKDAREFARSCELILIGTPPDARMKVLRELDCNNNQVILLEKPIVAPGPDLKELKSLVNKNQNTIFVSGYDHVVSPSFLRFQEIIRDLKTANQISQILVNFRESWAGILNAHNWLHGPEDSYLGYSLRGGGALCEHSHGLNAGLIIANMLDNSFINAKSAYSCKRSDSKSPYDCDLFSSVYMKTKEVSLRVEQDVLTSPARKFIRVEQESTTVEWICNNVESKDQIVIGKDGRIEIEEFPKTRADDFKYEIEHLKNLLGGKIKAEDSNIEIKKAILTSQIINESLKME